MDEDLLELLLMNLLQKLHDSPLVGLTAGLVYGSLSAIGFMVPGHQDGFVQAVQAIVGGIVGVLTIVGYFNHKTQTDKAKIATNSPTPPATPLIPAA